jgi:hypothetical protein
MRTMRAEVRGDRRFDDRRRRNFQSGIFNDARAL